MKPIAKVVRIYTVITNKLFFKITSVVQEGDRFMGEVQCDSWYMLAKKKKFSPERGHNGDQSKIGYVYWNSF